MSEYADALSVDVDAFWGARISFDPAIAYSGARLTVLRCRQSELLWQPHEVRLVAVEDASRQVPEIGKCLVVLLLGERLEMIRIFNSEGVSKDYLPSDYRVSSASLSRFEAVLRSVRRDMFSDRSGKILRIIEKIAKHCFEDRCDSRKVLFPDKEEGVLRKTIGAFVKHDGMRTAEEVVIAEKDDSTFIGYRCLLGWGLLVTKSEKLACDEALFHIPDFGKLNQRVGANQGSVIPPSYRELYYANSISSFFFQQLLQNQLTFASILDAIFTIFTKFFSIAEVYLLDGKPDSSGWKIRLMKRPSRPGSVNAKVIGETVSDLSSKFSECHIIKEFPLAQRKSTPISNRLACVVLGPEKSDSKKVEFALDFLGPVVSFALQQYEENHIHLKSRRDVDMSLDFPASKEGDVSYRLLDLLTQIRPSWKYASFWRYSRRSLEMQRMAALENPRNDKKKLKEKNIESWEPFTPKTLLEDGREHGSIDSKSEIDKCKAALLRFFGEYVSRLHFPLPAFIIIKELCTPTGSEEQKVEVSRTTAEYAKLVGIPARVLKKKKDSGSFVVEPIGLIHARRFIVVFLIDEFAIETSVSEPKIAKLKASSFPPGQCEKNAELSDLDYICGKLFNAYRANLMRNVRRLLNERAFRVPSKGWSLMLSDAKVGSTLAVLRTKGALGYAEKPPFESFVSVSFDEEIVSLDYAEAARAIRSQRELGLSRLPFDITSKTRYRIGCLTEIEKNLEVVASPEKLAETLSASLERILAARDFLVIDTQLKVVNLASEALQEMDLCVDELPNLPERTEIVHHDAQILDTEPMWMRQVSRALLGDENDLACGAAKVRVGSRYLLYVFAKRERGWSVGSIEASVLTLLASFLKRRESLFPSRPIVRSGSSGSNPDWYKEQIESLLNQSIELPLKIEEILQELSNKLHESNPIFMAIDIQQKFGRLLAGNTVPNGASKTVCIEDASYFSRAIKWYCSKRSGEGSNLMGVISDDGKRVLLDNPTEPNRRDEVSFYNLIDAKPGDKITAVPVLRPSSDLDDEPQQRFYGLIIAIVERPSGGGGDEMTSKPREQSPIDLISHYASLIELWIRWQTENSEKSIEGKKRIRRELDRINSPQRDWITKFSDLQSKKEELTEELPVPLRRLFTAKYCTSMNRLLAAISDYCVSSSISFRVLYPDKYGKKEIWRISSAGDSEIQASYEYNPQQNVQSYACSLLDGGSSLVEVFLPDVSSETVSDTLYPGVVYLNDNSRVRSQLCFGVNIGGHEDMAFVFNIESTSFRSLWLSEEFLREIAMSLGQKTIDHLNRRESYTEAAIELSKQYLDWIEHSISRPIGQLESRYKYENAQNDQFSVAEDLVPIRKNIERKLKVISELGGMTSNEPLLDKIAKAKNSALRRFENEIKKGEDKSNLFPVKFTLGPDGGHAEANWPESLSLLFEELLYEQLKTMHKIQSQYVNSLIPKIYILIRDCSTVDMVSNVEPKRQETKDLAPYLFWYKIDNPSREAMGVSGRGLYLLGHLFRFAGITPSANAVMPASVVETYRKLDVEGIGEAKGMHFVLRNIGLKK